MFFPRLEEDNIYRSYALSEREIVFQFFFFFFGKQLIENMSYFYKSFPLTNILLHYQTLENVENNLYKRFSSETNRARKYVIIFRKACLVEG